MYYDKRIRYLSYYESDIKLQNAGYVKFQVRDSLCQMIIYVKGPRLMGNGEAAVYLLSRKSKETDGDSFYSGGRDSRLQKHLLGNLSIRGGQGHCAVRMNSENMADSGMRYDEICGIRIELHEYQYLESQWSVVNPMPEREGRSEGKGMGYQLRQPQTEPVKVDLIVTPASENVRVEKLLREESMEEPVREEPMEEPVREESKEEPLRGELMTEPVREESMAELLREEPMEELLREEPVFEEVRREEIPERVVHGETAEETAEEMAEETAEEMAKGDLEDSMQEMIERKVREEYFEHSAQREPDREDLSAESEPEVQELKSDKWEQLRNTYPIVHPIREEEEYLKVSPRDFVIFSEKYQQLVHNSFLLHGYHNYKHLILGKKEKDGKVVYYLGVPGTFHDREKAVAVMFGFEAFDGKREPAQTGDFGYYLRRVEL